VPEFPELPLVWLQLVCNGVKKFHLGPTSFADLAEIYQFWHDEFTPLAEQEHALRERLLLVGQSVSPERATQ
jgi:hypothetical protein